MVRSLAPAWQQRHSGRVRHQPGGARNLVPLRLAVIALAIAFIAAPTMPGAGSAIAATPTTLTFLPEADARVQESAPTTNYGTYKTLIADGGSDPDIESYLRFAVGGLPGPVTSAKLRLYTTNGTVDGPAVYATSSTWGENTITWNTRPARTSGPQDDKGAIAVNTWVEYDVTALVTGNGTVSFVLATSSTDDLQAPSREGVQRPELVVTSNGS